MEDVETNERLVSWTGIDSSIVVTPFNYGVIVEVCCRPRKGKESNCDIHRYL
jgi:hypothetical protein